MTDTGTLLPSSKASNMAAMDVTVGKASPDPVTESEKQAEGSPPVKDIQITSNAEAPNQQATNATISDCPGDILGPDGKDIEYGTNLHYEAGKSYPILSSNTPQQRRKQAVLRLAQSKAYAELIEERLVHLEKVLAELQPKGHKTLAEDDDDNEAAPKSVASIKVMGWTDFRATPTPGSAARTHRPEFDRAPRSLIEILREDPGYPDNSISPDHDSDVFGTSGVNTTLGRQSTESITKAVDFEPHEIRIHSRVLLQVLNDITGCNTTPGQWKHKITFLRPFKLLVYFEQNFNDRLRHLERLHSGDRLVSGM